MAIVAYRYIPPCFDSRYGESNWTTNPTKFTTRKQGAVFDQWTAQDQKSLFSVQATRCRFSNIQHLSKRFALYIQNKFCLSKNGIARQYWISLEKENDNDIGTHLDFRQEGDIRITTSKTQRCNNVSFWL